ncbi:MAG: RES family NAD+ phosphorylase [Robiginitalea sp.]|jgi:RES domain-containing protein|uniref:RES family NAD+ phosphorylase n=1 Tax=Robiginitalea sp. TaxID=1902411 RepID=UPI003C778F53
MIVFRIAKSKYKTDLSGTGAELHGGRWNNKGTKLIYTASSRALAMVEVAVHVSFNILPKDYFLVSIEVPDSKMRGITENDLKDIHWKSNPPSYLTQDMGDTFVAEQKSLILQVPSAVVPGDYNYLINPLHQDISKVKILSVESFDFDDRLFKTE